jgi:hypothetical protein
MCSKNPALPFASIRSPFTGLLINVNNFRVLEKRCEDARISAVDLKVHTSILPKVRCVPGTNP